MRQARSSSNSLKYTDDDDDKIDAEYLNKDYEQIPENLGLSMIVEKVLGRKFIPVSDDTSEMEELYFIKWKKVLQYKILT